MRQVQPKIIYEDDEVLVLNKPAGLAVHGDGRSKTATLIDWLMAHYPTIGAVGEPMRLKSGEIIPRPGIVHRLDRDTSGVMIVAKTQPAFKYLKKKFQTHDLIKHYRAIAHGRIKAETGTINLAIGRSRQDARERLAGHGAVGQLREASTAYQVLKYFKGYTYLEAAPLTGRTHQLRVHFRAIGHPLVGDQLYATGHPATAKLPSLGRQALHSYSLKINLPNGQIKEFQAPLPADFQAALDYLETKC